MGAPWLVLRSGSASLFAGLLHMRRYSPCASVRCGAPRSVNTGAVVCDGVTMPGSRSLSDAVKRVCVMCACGVLAAVAGCAPPTKVTTLPAVSTAAADASMKSSALAADAQVHGWITVHNRVVSGTESSTPAQSVEPSRSASAEEPSAAAPSTAVSGQSQSASASAVNDDAYLVLPADAQQAGRFMTLLDTDDVLTGYTVTPSSSARIDPATVTTCVAVSRRDGAVSGSQAAWVVYRSAQSSVLAEGVTSCDRVPESLTEVPFDTHDVFAGYAADVPASTITGLGQAAARYGPRVLTALSSGVAAALVAQPSWTPPSP